MVRTFVAVELPEVVRAELGRSQREMQRLARARNLPIGSSLKWVAPEGIHLTLKFLGEVPEAMVEPIAEAVQVATAGRPALNLELSGRGAFPSARSPRVLWVGLAGDLAALADLQRVVEQELGRLGFAPENRAFSPHLTLARVREQAAPVERRAVAELLTLPQSLITVRFIAGQVSLMKSELRPSGARYEALSTFTLRS